MKRFRLNNALIYGLPLLISILTSCDSWINVDPTDRLSEEMQFKDKAGFVKALNGVYIELNASQLYGLDLTAGALDAMGNYYTYNGSSSHRFYQYTRLEYSDSNVKTLFDNMWQKAYRVIANVNTIIEKTESDNCPLSEPYHNMIQGEALALRAMLHFDMLRVFGPLTTELDKTAIPYQTSSAQEITPLLTGNQVLINIINDLKTAVSLLQMSDPYLSQDLSSYDEVDIKNRQFRLNYFAAKALLARVYLWKGDKVNAYNLANEVIKTTQEGEKVIFPFVTNTAATNTSSPDRVFSSEVLFAAYNSLRENDIHNRLFTPTLDSQNLCTFAGTLDAGRVNELYEDKNDYRYQIWATYNNNGVNVLYHRKFENVTSNSSLNYMVPLIRLSEMYLIATETAPDIATATIYFNKLRNARNCFSQTLNGDELTGVLANEYKKEMIGEGQLFFFYKRLAFSHIPDGNSSTGTKSVDASAYVTPLPDSETSERTE